jgi:hypothetical protein
MAFPAAQQRQQIASAGVAREQVVVVTSIHCLTCSISCSLTSVRIPPPYEN